MFSLCILASCYAYKLCVRIIVVSTCFWDKIMDAYQTVLIGISLDPEGWKRLDNNNYKMPVKYFMVDRTTYCLDW